MTGLDRAGEPEARSGRTLRQPRRLVIRLERHRQQPPVRRIGPGVIGTADRAPGIPAPLAQDLGALVGAAVDEHPDRGIALPHHDHRAGADGGGQEIAGRRHLARVADIDPALPEQALVFEREDFGIDIDIAMHPIGLDQRFDSQGIVAISRHQPSALPPLERARVDAAGRSRQVARAGLELGTLHLLRCGQRQRRHEREPPRYLVVGELFAARGPRSRGRSPACGRARSSRAG